MCLAQEQWILDHHDKFFAEGKAEGKAEGVELAKTAINMLKDGIAIDQICKETGLTEAQVAELQTLL